MKSINRLSFCFTAITLLLVFAGMSPASAQDGTGPASLENVHLWINPEYDDPRLLVMLEGQIAGVQAPVRVRFLVPSAAEMYSAGSKDAQGKYTGGPPDRQPSSRPGWDEISYEVQTSTFRVEYYDPSITGQPDRSISYEFLRLYPISNLQVIIQQPRSAGNFSVSPAGQSYIDIEGFDTYVYSYSALAEDTPVRFQIGYTKSDTRPSLDIEDTGSSVPLAAIMVILVFVLVIAGIFLWRGKSRTQNRATRRRASDNTARKQPPDHPESGFCPRCGKPLAGSDKFCPDCGARLSARG